MSEKQADFYDQGFADPRNLALRPLEQSPWLPLYSAAASQIPQAASIVDLGCGTGRFARLLYDDPARTGSYIGIDFSEVAIEEARRYVPQAEFRVADLRDCEIPEADIYVCLEVLEHIDDDLGLLRRLPAGAGVVMSVPSFKAETHVRSFPSAADSIERYDEVVGLSAWQRIPAPDTFIHLLQGGKR